MGGRRAYYLSQSQSNAGRKMAKGLHVAIWEFKNKAAVPVGHVCHHKDGNSFNNDPSNLEVLSKTDHFKHHPYIMTSTQAVHLDRVRPLAKAWHASEDGLRWHAENSVKMWEKRKKRTIQCETCGKDMLTRAIVRRYCNSYCNYLALKKLGHYDRQVFCVICEKSFETIVSCTGKVSSTCSRSCRGKLRASRSKQAK